MRRWDYRTSEPRSDGFAFVGLVLVILMTLCAFAFSGAFLLNEPVARAYTLSELPKLPGDDVAPPSAAPEEVAPVPAPVSTKQGAAPLCNVAKCAATYRSFDVDDCTFQPFEGERRLCPY